MIHPSKTLFSFPLAAKFGTVNPEVLGEVHRVVVSVEICRAAEAALTSREQAGVPVPDRGEKMMLAHYFIFFWRLPIDLSLWQIDGEKVNHSPFPAFWI